MNKSLCEKAFESICLTESVVCNKLYVYDTIDSTNDELKKCADCGAAEGTVAISDCQTNGHGRSGRNFFSPHGGNLYFSVLLRPERIEDAKMITPAAAVAVSRAISKVCQKEVGIKWVNDLFYNKKKVCGILAQAYNVGRDDFYVVLGIGINVFVSVSEVPEEIKDIYGSLYSDKGSDVDLENIIAKLSANVFGEFMKIYGNFPNNDFMTEYKKRSIVIGKNVSYLVGEREESILVTDIDDEGRLVVKNQDGIISSYSDGEIRIKLY